MIKDHAGGPAIALMVSGVLGLVYNLVYLAWTVLPLIMGVFSVFAVLDSPNGASDMVLSLSFLLIPIFQFLAFVVALVLSGLTLWAGMLFNQFRSKGLVYLGIAASTAVPLLGMFSNSISSLNCMTFGTGLFGCFLGNVAMLPLLVMGLIATIWALVAITGPMGDSFEEVT